MKVSVYCSGSITKGSRDRGKLTWSDTERMEVAKGAAPHEVVFLNPDDPITDPGNILGQFGRDMYQVMIATAVVVDARERRGLGIGVEMAAAAAFGTPVVTVAPPNSKYRADLLEYRGATVRDYVHPHVAALSAAVVEDFLRAGEALAALVEAGGVPATGDVPGWLGGAISEYRHNVLHGDVPMLEALRLLDRTPG